MATMVTRDVARPVEERPPNSLQPYTAASWRPLYRIGGAAALTVASLTVVQIAVFVASPPPTTVIGYFQLLQSSRLLGLLDLDLLSIANFGLTGLVFLALYGALRRASPALTAIALVACLVGVATYFASNTAFNMLILSNQYAAATTEVQRAAALAAGQATLAIYQGTAFDVSYVLAAISGLLIAAVMLRSRIFTRWTASAGVAAFALGLIPPTAGMIGLACSLASLAPLLLWEILVARGLFRLGRGPGDEEAPGKSGGE